MELKSTAKVLLSFAVEHFAGFVHVCVSKVDKQRVLLNMQWSASGIRATGRMTQLSSAPQRTLQRVSCSYRCCVGRLLSREFVAKNVFCFSQDACITCNACQHTSHSHEAEGLLQAAGLHASGEEDALFSAATRMCACRARAVLDDSAHMMLLTEVWRGFAYTLGAFFDKKVTVSY